MTLSSSMQECLHALQQAGGDEAIADLPGGRRTVEALARRGLVYIDGAQAGLTVEGRAFHVHRFRFTTHLDGCHWTHSWGHCACGARISNYAERDLKWDPYAVVFLADDCERCRELAEGAEPEFRSRVSGKPA